MTLNYQDIREQMEADGYKVDDDEFPHVLSYAKRKAEIAGKDEAYLTFLLPDVIREWVIRKHINWYSMAIMEVFKIKKEEEKAYGTGAAATGPESRKTDNNL